MPDRRQPQGYYKRVWEIVRLIPSRRGSPRSANLPWHRVIGAGGKILLSGEAGIEQRLRLEAEGVAFRGARVQMSRHEYRFRRAGAIPRGRSPGGNQIPRASAGKRKL